MRRKTGYCQQRGQSWRISYYDCDHIRHFETYKSEELAHVELAKRLAEIAQGVPVSSKPNTVLFGELAADVLNDYRVNAFTSIKDQRRRFDLHILPVFGKKRASQITTAQLKAYILRRQATEPLTGSTEQPTLNNQIMPPKHVPASTGTINRELELIRHTFKLAIQGRKLLYMPHVPHLRENNARKGFFSREEVERLCQFLKPPLDSLTWFAFLTGWRLGECKQLQWRNVDFDRGEIRLDPGSTKNLDGRVFPMTTELRALLDNVNKADTAVNFTPANQTIISMIGKRMVAEGAHVFPDIGDFRKSWARGCYKAGLPCTIELKPRHIIPHRIFHDLRRSAARELQRQGFTDGQIMRMCGWRTRSVFDRYNITTDEDIRTRMLQIEALHEVSK